MTDKNLKSLLLDFIYKKSSVKREKIMKCFFEYSEEDIEQTLCLLEREGLISSDQNMSDYTTTSKGARVINKSLEIK